MKDRDTEESEMDISNQSGLLGLVEKIRLERMVLINILIAKVRALSADDRREADFGIIDEVIDEIEKEETDMNSVRMALQRLSIVGSVTSILEHPMLS